MVYITLPGVIKRLIINVINMMNNMGLNPLITNLTGTFEIVIITVKNIITNMNPVKLSIKNNEIIKINVMIILSLGSRLCMGESTG
jgi:hypothetical protein